MKKSPLKSAGPTVPAIVPQLSIAASIQDCIERTKTALARASAGILKTVPLCAIAGQRLNELKGMFPHGSFEDKRKELCGEKSTRTLQRYQAIASAFLQSRDMPPSDEFSSVADILEADDASLKPDELKFKRVWFSIVHDKTVNEVLQSSVIEDKDPLAFQRALNGSLHGGTNEDDLRNDYPRHIDTGLKKVSSHFSHWPTMDEIERRQSINVLHSFVTLLPPEVSSQLALILKKSGEFQKR